MNPNVSLCPLAMLLPYITAAFQPTTSYGFTAHLSINWDDDTDWILQTDHRDWRCAELKKPLVWEVKRAEKQEVLLPLTIELSCSTLDHYGAGVLIDFTQI